MGGYFTSDRAAKYGWGVPRLALVTLFAFEIVPRAFLAGSRAPVDALVSTPLPFTARAAAAPFAPLTLVPYLHSLRWIAHAYTGSIGAGVNVQVLGLLGNLAIMAVAGGLCLWDLTKDISLVVYFLKTFCGDQLAGKLDTAEWKLVLAFTFALPLAMWGAAGANGAAFAMFLPYARIAPILFAIQAVCEFGDAVKEAYHEIELNHPELRGGDPAGHHRQRAEGERLEAVPVAEELADDGVVLEVRVAELAYGLNGKENWCNPGVG